MQTTSANHPVSRMDRLIHEHVHDPYKTKHKPPQPTVCPVCNGVFRDGRWQWTESWPMDAHREMCQACHRTQDAYPAGVVTLTGAFVREHQTEILSLVRHLEKEENREHPLHRIMKVEERPPGIVISTTDIHLPHRIAEALRHAYKGEVQIHYDEEGYFVRANWKCEL